MDDGSHAPVLFSVRYFGTVIVGGVDGVSQPSVSSRKRVKKINAFNRTISHTVLRAPITLHSVCCGSVFPACFLQHARYIPHDVQQ